MHSVINAHCNLQTLYAECQLCLLSFMHTIKHKPFMLNVIMLSVIKLSVIMLSVIKLSVIMLNVIKPSVKVPSRALVKAGKRLKFHFEKTFKTRYHLETPTNIRLG